MVKKIITQTCDPLKARWWFNHRGSVNALVTGLLFALFFCVIAFFANGLIASAICIPAAYWFFFNILDKRAITIVCPHCGKYIETNTPWVCGYKQCRNENVDDFPFIFRCEHCKAAPKSYKCHHKDCGKLIHFTKDLQNINYAQCVNFREEVKQLEVKKDEYEDTISQKKKNLQVTELDVKQAELEVKLKSFKDVLDPAKPKSVRERLRSKVGSKTELEDEVERMKAEADEKFKDNPIEREKQHRIIESEARDLM